MKVDWNEELRDLRKQKELVYRSPIPRKRQRISHCRGRDRLPGKCKVYTRQEILLYEEAAK